VAEREVWYHVREREDTGRVELDVAYEATCAGAGCSHGRREPMDVSDRRLRSRPRFLRERASVIAGGGSAC
jgi:hypothetical protein